MRAILWVLLAAVLMAGCGDDGSDDPCQECSPVLVMSDYTGMNRWSGRVVCTEQNKLIESPCPENEWRPDPTTGKWQFIVICRGYAEEDVKGQLVFEHDHDSLCQERIPVQIE